MFYISSPSDTDAGKTELLHQFDQNRKGSTIAAGRQAGKAGLFPHTIGGLLHVIHVNVRGKKVKLQIWDTASQERFRAIRST